MPSHPPPNNPLVVKVALVFSRDTRTFVNTFHVTDSTGWDISKMNTLANDFKTWWTTYYGPNMPTAIALQQIQVRLLDPSNPLAVDYTSGLPLNGGSAGAMEAANVTNTLSWRTGLAGRKYRGRTYVPGLAENQTNQNDTITGAMVSAMTSIAAGYLTTIGVGTRFPVIFHLATNLFTRVVTFVIENILDSQRRRLPGRGR